MGAADSIAFSTATRRAAASWIAARHPLPAPPAGGVAAASLAPADGTAAGNLTGAGMLYWMQGRSCLEKPPPAVELAQEEDGLWRRGDDALSAQYLSVRRHSSGRWEAAITAGGEQECLGPYATEAEASAAYEARCRELGQGPDPQPTSEFLGVSWDKARDKWEAQIWVANTRVFLGRFVKQDEVGAPKAYAAARAVRDGLRKAGVPPERIVMLLQGNRSSTPEKLIALCREHGTALAQDRRGGWSWRVIVDDGVASSVA